MRMNRNCILVFSGYNQRAITAFCRFAVSSEVAFSIVARDSDDPIFLTEYASSVIETRGESKLMLDRIKLLCSRACEIHNCFACVLLPSSEFLNRFFLENRESLEASGAVIPLCSKKIYETLSDKYSFGGLCAENQIAIPETLPFPDEFEYPFVAKPRAYSSPSSSILNPVIIEDKISYECFQCSTEKDDYYYQQYIHGDSFYLLYFFGKDGSYSCYSQQNLIQQWNGRSVIAALSSSIHESPIGGQYAVLLKNIGFTGLIMIEIRKSFADGQFYMIEANPRLWGPSQLILDSEMDLFARWANEYNLNSQIPLPSKYIPNTTYFWSGGIVADQVKSCQTSFHNFTHQAFFVHYRDFVLNDIYARKDTINLYLSELHG